MHANATKPSSAIFSVSGHIAAMWCELIIARTATPFSLAAFTNSGIDLFNTTGAKQFLPSALITEGVNFFISGFCFPLIFPLFKPETYAGKRNKPCESEPSLSALVISSDKISAVS